MPRTATRSATDRRMVATSRQYGLLVFALTDRIKPWFNAGVVKLSDLPRPRFFEGKYHVTYQVMDLLALS